MEHNTDKIHIMPLGDQWEVEAQSGAPLAHAPDRDSAIALARSLASEAGQEVVILHDGDGVTEEITVTGEADAQPTNLSPEQTNPQ